MPNSEERTLTIGQSVIWRRVRRGGYIERIPAIVRKIGQKVTIEVQSTYTGITIRKLVSVFPSNLTIPESTLEIQIVASVKENTDD